MYKSYCLVQSILQNDFWAKDLGFLLVSSLWCDPLNNSKDTDKATQSVIGVWGAGVKGGEGNRDARPGFSLCARA